MELKTKRENGGSNGGKKANNSTANSASTSPRNRSSHTAHASASTIPDTKIATLPTSEIFGYLYQELQAESQPPSNHGSLLQPPPGSSGAASGLPSQKDMQVERLVNRSMDQLASDMDEIKAHLEENKREIDRVSDNLLNLIVMIKRDDLTAL